MIWFVLAAIVTVAIPIKLYFDGHDELVAKVVGIGLLATMAALTLNYSFGFFNTYPKSEHYCNLQAISTEQQGRGSAFLGSGSFESGPGYLYYCKDGESSYHPETINIGAAWIIEDAGEGKTFSEPVVRTNPSHPGNKWLSIWAFETYVTEFHVPPGSVVQDYSINH